MQPQAPLREAERTNYDFFLNLPEISRQEVDSGVWPLYRFDPRRLVKGEPPLHLDYGAPKAKVADYMRNETRFRQIERADPARFKRFLEESQAAAQRRYAVYQQLAGIKVPVIETEADGPAAPPAKQEGQ